MRPRRTWGHAAHAATTGKTARADERRAHAAGAPAHQPAPHAAGEDVRALTGDAQPAARPLGRAGVSARTASSATPRRRYPAGAEALTDEARPARWRQPRPPRAALRWTGWL